MGTRSLRSLIPPFLAGAALLALPATLLAGTGAEAARAASEQQSKQVIPRLFAACPGAKALLRASEGYATFAGVGAGAGGTGVARPTRTRQPVYMRFDDKGATGGKRDLVFMFSTRDGFSNFAVKGASLGGAAEAGAQGDCSQALAPGVRVFQVEGKQMVGGAVPAARYSGASLD